MEQLTSLISIGSWSEALTFSNSLGLSPSYVSQLHFLSLPSTSLTSNLTEELLNSIEDKLWVVSASFQLINNNKDFETIKKSIEIGLKATESYIESQENLKELVTNEEIVTLERLFNDDEQVKKLVLLRKGLLEFSDRFKTWDEIWGSSNSNNKSTEKVGKKVDGNEMNDDEEDEETNGWDELESPTSPTELQSQSHSSVNELPSHPSLSTFLTTPILDIVFSLAASASLESLIAVCKRHTDETWPFRFEILASIPEWIEPSRFTPLLPSVDEIGMERKWENQSWRKDLDWVEKLPSILNDRKEGQVVTSVELTKFYEERINNLSSLGLISIALSLVQHCGSLGISGLDELGEELSLLGKLVYDRPSIPSTSTLATSIETEDLTLKYWHSLSPTQVVQAYLAYSTTSTIASDIRRLVLPYLFVLESRLERAGTPNPLLSVELLTELILNLASESKVDLLVPIFIASNPTLPASQRLIESDSVLAKLSLACIYGSKETSFDALGYFSKIFENLPAFDDDPTDTSIDQNLFDSNITSYTPQDLFNSLESFSTRSLSKALDGLDLHLATAEILSRYSVPVNISWFLSSHNDAKAQLNWAIRMARTSSTGGSEGTEFESEDEWEGLLEDMVGLTEEIDEDVEGMKKAFWLVGTEEVTKIFFAGLLSSGNFALAKRLLHPSNAKPPLSPGVEEELIITASHEFYDNAESGNLHKGEMKLAFDCLAAATQTPRIKKERDFIEATSRLCSFKIYSQPGIPIIPIQIRSSKNKLDFVARLLASNEDAYRHPDVVMELVRKLGYEGDKGAEIKVLAMIADSGLQAGDYSRAADVCDKMVAVVELLRKDKSNSSNNNGLSIIELEKMVEEGAEVTWRNCFQLGKHEDFTDLDRRMKLLGQALILCPGSKISTLLPVWSNLENLILNKGLPEQEDNSIASTSSHSYTSNTTVPPAIVVAPTGPSRTFTRAAAFLPFAIGPPRISIPRILSPQPPPPPPPAPIRSPSPRVHSNPPPPPAIVRTPIIRPRSQSPAIQSQSKPLMAPPMKNTLSNSTTSQSRNQSSIQRNVASPPLPPSSSASGGRSGTFSPPPMIPSSSRSPTSFQPPTQFGNRRSMNRSGSGSSINSLGSIGSSSERGIGYSNSMSPSSQASNLPSLAQSQTYSQSQQSYSQPQSQSQNQSQQNLSQSQRSYSSQSQNYQQNQQSQRLNQSTNSNSNSNPNRSEMARELWDQPEEGLFGNVGGVINSSLTKGVGWLIGANEQ